MNAVAASSCGFVGGDAREYSSRSTHGAGPPVAGDELEAARA
jgi:hypothetical protein